MYEPVPVSPCTARFRGEVPEFLPFPNLLLRRENQKIQAHRTSSQRSVRLQLRTPGPAGSVDPPTAPILRDGDVYTFTDNIYETIVVQRDNITVDGNGYMLQGEGSGKGFDLSNRNNVTIKNTHITEWYYGPRSQKRKCRYNCGA